MIRLSRSAFRRPSAVVIMAGLDAAAAPTLLALPAMWAAGFRFEKEPALG